MRVLCPKASAGDSHVNHRGGESKQLLWCASGGPSHAHITSQHVLACSERGCVSFPWPPRYCTWQQQFLDYQAKPTQGIATLCPPIPQPPQLLPAPAVMEKGCHCPRVPRGWRAALPWPWVPRVIEGGRWGGVSRGSTPSLGRGWQGTGDDRAEESLWPQPQRRAGRRA